MSILQSLIFSISATLAGASAVGPVELTGLVQDEKGRPLPGASVFIDSAAPRKGVGVL